MIHPAAMQRNTRAQASILLLPPRSLAKFSRSIERDEFIQWNFQIDAVATMPRGRYSIYRPGRVVLVAPRRAA
jgi:hypothetical protein